MIKFSDRANAIHPFYAMAFSEKASALESKGHDVIRLNIGEPNFGAPEPVLKAMENALACGDFPYTSALGSPELRHAVADFYQQRHKVNIKANNVVITAGASAALLLVCSALINPNDKVMLADPAYPCNRQFIRCFGGVLQSVLTDEKSRFQLDLSAVRNEWREETKGVMLASPSNPTGTSVSPEDLKAICDFAKSKSAWRIVDEIYLNLSHRDDAQTALAFDPDVIVINSFSKYFGMTGWRLGWCVVPDEMLPVVEKLAQNLYICPSTLAQKAALACFSKDSLAICEQRRQSLIKRKNWLLEKLSASSLKIDLEPDGAFYLYIGIKHTGMSSMNFCERLLDEHHLALTPGNDFSETTGDDYVRLSFAASDKDLEEGLRRLHTFLSKIVK